VILKKGKKRSTSADKAQEFELVAGFEAGGREIFSGHDVVVEFRHDHAWVEAHGLNQSLQGLTWFDFKSLSVDGDVHEGLRIVVQAGEAKTKTAPRGARFDEWVFSGTSFPTAA
jgi:hypothetical protein